LLFSAMLTIGFYFWEFPFHPLINITLKSTLVAIVYILVAVKFNFSEDINIQVSKYLNRGK